MTRTSPRYMLPPSPPATWPKPCEHPKLPRPPFDAEAARDLSAEEVQRRWPRSEKTCPDCGARMILYASAEHLVMGDWW